MWDAYTYIDDDRIVITRLAVITEIDAIKALQSGNASALLASDPAKSGKSIDSHRYIHQAVEKMMQEGWVRPTEGFMAAKRSIWCQNEKVVERLLRDLWGWMFLLFLFVLLDFVRWISLDVWFI
jgi:hypothetical protein